MSDHLHCGNDCVHHELVYGHVLTAITTGENLCSVTRLAFISLTLMCWKQTAKTLILETCIIKGKGKAVP